MFHSSHLIKVVSKYLLQYQYTVLCHKNQNILAYNYKWYYNKELSIRRNDKLKKLENYAWKNRDRVNCGLFKANRFLLKRQRALN